MNLKIGIIGSANGWKSLLRQIGVPFAAVTGTLKTDDFSAVVVSDDVNERESKMLCRYLERGGAALCSVKVYSRIHPMKVRSMNVKFFSGPDPVFNSIGVIDIAAVCTLARNANCLKANTGDFTAYAGTDKERVIALPFDAGELVRDSRKTVKSFYSPERRLPFERVSQTSKGEIRILVSNCLELLHHLRGLPYVHLWHFPGGARSVFCFRVDTDYGTEEQMRKLSGEVHKNRIPATWFIDAKSHEKLLHSYSKMRNQEIGVHCFEHKTYQDYESNVQNIRNAQRTLRTVKLKAKGFAAPYGEWNEELGRAIFDCGFEYSSEFSYDYDNMPGVPQIAEGRGVLQIPIHPICIGSLKRNGYSKQQMIAYFKNVINRKLQLSEPIIFYHHPGDEHYNVLGKLFQIIRDEKILAENLNEWARWWKMRISAVPKFLYKKGIVYIQGVGPDGSLCVRITQSDGTQAILPASKRIALGKVRWRHKAQEWIMPDDYLRIRRFNYRIPLVRILDIVTNFIQKKRK
jgi:hypothetical protein